MLKDVQERFSELFTNHFNQVFEGRLETETTWGFPMITISLSSKEEKSSSTWVFNINTIDGNYSLSAKASVTGEKETVGPGFTTISSEIIDYVVKTTINLNTSIFGQNEAKEEKELKEVPETAKEA